MSTMHRKKAMDRLIDTIGSNLFVASQYLKLNHDNTSIQTSKECNNSTITISIQIKNCHMESTHPIPPRRCNSTLLVSSKRCHCIGHISICSGYTRIARRLLLYEHGSAKHNIIITIAKWYRVIIRHLQSIRFIQSQRWISSNNVSMATQCFFVHSRERWWT